MTLHIAELCAGYTGLGMAIGEVLGGELVAVADNDPGASAILACRFPSVPNYTDITTADWAEAGSVDILAAGFPCQPVSLAGKQLGEADERWIWPSVVRAVRDLRPGLVFLENVSALVVRGLAGVAADLAEIGYVGSWCCVRASDVGAPHRRERVFILAWPAADADDNQQDKPASADRTADERAAARRPVLRIGGCATADAAGVRLPLRQPEHLGRGSRAAVAPDGRDTAEHDGIAYEGFAVAEDADGAAGGERRLPAPGQAAGGRSRADAGRPGGVRATADTRSSGLEVGAVEPDRDERPAAERGSGDAPADTPGDGRDEGRPEPAGLIRGPDAAARGIEPCPSCGCGVYFHDHGGFCAGPCGGNCTDPGLGRPDGGWNSFEDDADPAEVRAYALAHSAGIRHGDAGAQGQRGIPAAAVPGAPAGSDGDGLARSPERHGEPLVGQARHEQRRVDPLRRVLDWGNYAPAIRRWEAVLGRPAPRPTEPGRTGERLSPRFVEWMMGLPEGWVTDVPGLSRNAQLKALGNGVVPQQAAMALRMLLERAGIPSRTAEEAA